MFDGRMLGTAGFRVDGNSQFGKEVSPAWSVAIPIKKISTTLRGSYSEGFRAPAFDELYFPFFGNPNLGPEISSEYDGGFTTNFGESASFTATYFSRRVHNLIVTVPVPVGPRISSVEAGNAGRVDVQGVEIVPSLTIVKGLTLSGNVTMLDETHADSRAHGAAAAGGETTASSLVQYVRGGIFFLTTNHRQHELHFRRRSRRHHDSGDPPSRITTPTTGRCGRVIRDGNPARLFTTRKFSRACRT